MYRKKAWRATNGAGLQPAMDWYNVLINCITSAQSSLPYSFRMLEHPEVSDEPEEEEEQQPKELGSSSEPVQKEEGEIQQEEQTASSLICNDCQKLFRDGKMIKSA